MKNDKKHKNDQDNTMLKDFLTTFDKAGPVEKLLVSGCLVVLGSMPFNSFHEAFVLSDVKRASLKIAEQSSCLTNDNEKSAAAGLIFHSWKDAVGPFSNKYTGLRFLFETPHEEKSLAALEHMADNGMQICSDPTLTGDLLSAELTVSYRFNVNSHIGPQELSKDMSQIMRRAMDDILEKKEPTSNYVQRGPVYLQQPHYQSLK